MKSDRETGNQGTILPHGSNDYSDRDANDCVLPLLKWRSVHTDKEEIKGGGVQIANIDFPKQWSDCGTGSVHFCCEGLEDKLLRETDDTSN